ncbi:hypothetical protein [Paenibacillus ferrarius]|uniref:hypothetical protein n=1 Tax=Paenibacillus ferrarius TaxID=1469647 RepID=UPI003D291401
MDSTLETINKLILATDKGTVRWKPVTGVENNEELEEYLNKHADTISNTINNILIISQDTSYYVDYKKGKIYCFTKYFDSYPDKSYFIIAAQKDGVSKVLALNTHKEYQADLFRLFNIVERQVNKVTDFIGEFLSDNDI